MDIHAGQQRSYPALTIVALLLALCIILCQYWMTSLLPGISGFVTIRPSLVFFEIPAELPVNIDVMLVSVLFLLTYPIVILLYPPQAGLPSWQQAMQRVRSVFVGLFVLLCSMLSGGLIYYLVQDYLPRDVRNGINSFGINADIDLPFSGYQTIHLRGSMILLVCFIIGMIICIRKIRRQPDVLRAGQLTREQRMTPYERMLQEKKMKEKQMTKAVGMIQQQDGALPQKQVTTPVRSKPQGLCHNKPVTTLRPEAAYYMPSS